MNWGYGILTMVIVISTCYIGFRRPSLIPDRWSSGMVLVYYDSDGHGNEFNRIAFYKDSMQVFLRITRMDGKPEEIRYKSRLPVAELDTLLLSLRKNNIDRIKMRTSDIAINDVVSFSLTLFKNHSTLIRLSSDLNTELHPDDQRKVMIFTSHLRTLATRYCHRR